MTDISIIGAGGAGLLIAEALQRAGATVTLIDQAQKVCSVASSLNHSWFHTGALYSMFPTDAYFKAMVANMDVVLSRYQGFPNMNLRVDRGLISSGSHGWFGNRLMLYGFVSPGAPEVSWGLKFPWSLACLRARRRLGFYDSCVAGRSLSCQVRWWDAGPGAVRERAAFVGRLTGGGRGFWSADRTFDARKMMRDVLGSFLGNGGRLCLGHRAVKIAANEVVTDRGNIRARHVIVAAGHESSGLVGLTTRVVWSPLLVVWPALAAFNWVRMSPLMSQSLNHVVHTIDGESYSVVGSALYYPTPGDESSAEAASIFTSRLRGLFSDVERHHLAIYWGPKTEIVGSSQLRNYQSHIVDVGGVTAVLPGKLTLSFSLAAALCRRLGFEFCGKIGEFGDECFLDQVVAQPRHATEAHNLIVRALTSAGPGPRAVEVGLV